MALVGMVGSCKKPARNILVGKLVYVGRDVTGTDVGVAVGERVDGDADGRVDGAAVGDDVEGIIDGFIVGVDGDADGRVDGAAVGDDVEGIIDGIVVGRVLRVILGTEVEDFGVGAFDDITVGDMVGLAHLKS